jgi:hypothetical protein
MRVAGLDQSAMPAQFMLSRSISRQRGVCRAAIQKKTGGAFMPPVCFLVLTTKPPIHLVAVIVTGAKLADGPFNEPAFIWPDKEYALPAHLVGRLVPLNISCLDLAHFWEVLRLCAVHG